MTVNLTWKDVSQAPYNGSLELAINGQVSPPIASVQAGDTIYVPGGTYNVTTSLNVNQPNVRIVGDGIDRTIINCLGNANFAVFNITASFVTLEGFTVFPSTSPTGTAVGVQIGASAVIEETTLRRIKIRDMPSYALFIPGMTLASNQPVNETLLENVILTASRSNANVFIGRGNTLAVFRNCSIAAYGVAGTVGGIVIKNASNIRFDSCEGNTTPSTYWLDFEIDPNNTLFTSAGESLSVVNCDIELNRDAPAARHNQYFIHVKGAAHVLVENTVFYWGQKGIWLEGCHQAVLLANLFKDIRADSVSNPAPESVTLTTCTETSLIDSCWENTDVVGDTLPAGTSVGQRLPLPFQELSSTTGTTVLEQGVALLPTYGAVATSLTNDVVTGLLHSGMLAFDLKRRLLAWDGTISKWVRAVLGIEVLDVRDYASIQAAIDAVPAPGGIVYIPAGTYTSTSTPSYSGDLHVSVAGRRITLLGDGSGRTILQAPVGSTPMLRIEADDTVVEGITFEGANQTSSASGIVVGLASSAILRPILIDVTVQNSAGWSIRALGQESSASSHYSLWERVRCTGNRDATTGGVWFGRGCSNYTLRDCVVEVFLGYGILMDLLDSSAMYTCRIYDAFDDTQPYLKVNDSLNIVFEALRFRKQSGTQLQRFIVLSGENRNIMLLAPRFYRFGSTNPNAIDINGAIGIAKSVFIANPELAADNPVTGTDHFKIGSTSDVVLIGGVLALLDGSKPPIQIDGPVNRLPIAGRATIDFGSGASSAMVTVFDTGVLANSRIIASMADAATPGRDLDETEMDQFAVRGGNVVSGVSFDIGVESLIGDAHGTYYVDYMRS